MGTLVPGDYVFSPRGEPVRVTWVSPVEYAPRSYEVEFDTGEIIPADGDHLWRTMTKAERTAAAKSDPEWRARRRASRPSRAVANPVKPWVNPSQRNRERGGAAIEAPTGGIRTTEQIRDTLTVQDGREVNHSVAVTAPVELPEQALPIEPYLLGVWLGDGNSYTGTVGMAAADMAEIAVFLPVGSAHPTPNPRHKSPFVVIRFAGLTVDLRTTGVLKDKHIPMVYLRGSVAQRVALLQGLLDTDGHCDARGQIEIGLSNRRLAEGVHDLISTLGIKATMRTKPIRLRGKVCRPSYVLKFMAPFAAFRLPRKLARQKMEGFRDTVTRRYIVAVRKIAPVPMRCIRVDHPDGLYLVGRTMIATHNTDAVLGDWAIHADTYGPGAIGLMVRRSRTELMETFERARVIFNKLGAHITYQPMRITLPSLARLTFAYLEQDKDAELYQGASFSRIFVEEVGNFPSPGPIMKLMATLRSGTGVPVAMRLTGNPGGPGHQWVRARYIDPAPLGWQVLRDETGLERIYIPSRVGDNVYLGADYVQRLKASGSPELVRAWLEGDWSVVSGAFFPEFSMPRHVIAPRELPRHWPRFRSFDWGSARPFSVGWWAVSDGSLPDIARGCIVRYREWYGMQPGQPNVGLRMTAEAIAAGIKAREADDPAGMLGVADPAIFAEDGGPSIAMRMSGAGVHWRPADNKRVSGRGAIGGWDLVRQRLIGDHDGKPMMLMFSTCRDLIRTLPALQHDAARPEDVDTDNEDHAADECRYSCAARVWIRDVAKPTVRDPWAETFARGDEEAAGWRIS
ncbi:MAG TPA: LAGLIDADG family homing endonuclease [Steroidobacteraceae bacterium]|nr:LAGLIDADG family homing endonuclease [Steroidobacteraceae bacterium]